MGTLPSHSTGTWNGNPASMRRAGLLEGAVQALHLQAEGFHPRVDDLGKGVAVGFDGQEGQVEDFLRESGLAAQAGQAVQTPLGGRGGVRRERS